MCLDQVTLHGQIERMIGAGVKAVHIDLIDPHYGNLGLPPTLIADIKEHFDLTVETHLMVGRPAEYVYEVRLLGSDRILVHQSQIDEAVAEVLVQASENGAQIGVVVNADQRIDVDLAESVTASQITVMTVRPGGAGRPFIASALQNIADADTLRQRRVIERVEVDGAVGARTIGQLLDAGAHQFVLGSSAFKNRRFSEQEYHDIVAPALVGTHR
ncbi:hypothetical protein NONI108955_32065 [Nocardia ninae]|uniref:hypothetical protein n=1 Tax=Nocardia ninae TaxID=356145 RepID=UPI0011BFC943|nr:hypothetical protein [Nocardia ninae]